VHGNYRLRFDRHLYQPIRLAVYGLRRRTLSAAGTGGLVPGLYGNRELHVAAVLHLGGQLAVQRVR
jgi:hypothetical protein